MRKTIQSWQHRILKKKGGHSNCEESNTANCHECQARELPRRKMNFNETILRHKMINFSDAFCAEKSKHDSLPRKYHYLLLTLVVQF